MLHYIYKITCTEGKLKDHYYYGQHSTENLNDNYKGSGKILRDYYKKYPNSYIKEIISFHSSYEELDDAEMQIISSYIDDDKCLNITIAGKKWSKGCRSWHYGLPHEMQPNYGKYHSEETKQKISETKRGTPTWNKGIPLTEECKRKMSESLKGRKSPMEGKHHSEETKRKISETKKGTPAWNKGLHSSQETRMKLSKSHKGKPSYIKGKHKVWNDTHTSYHYE